MDRAPHPTPKIRLQGVSKSFQTRGGSVHALAETDLDIGEGEFLCLVGPSGCGKTTTLNLIAGMILPTTGSVTVDRRPVSGPGADRAMIFQADAVFPWLSVRGNVEYGLRLKKVARADRERTADHYIQLVGLSGAEGLYPKELSGGMKKRVDLARAYANDPDCLLMDEPFGSLDAITRERMQVELSRLFEMEKKTIIFVTHDLEEAAYLGDRIVVMTPRPGKVAQILAVPFPRPRVVQIKLTPEFQSLRAQMMKLLADAVTDGGQGATLGAVNK